MSGHGADGVAATADQRFQAGHAHGNTHLDLLMDDRAVEIDSEVADDLDRSVIHEQVEMGVAVRMACLEALIGGRRNAIGAVA